MKKPFLIPLLVIGLAGSSTFAVPAPERGLVTTTEIATVLQRTDFAVSASQIRLVTEVSSSHPEPTLEVVSAAPWGESDAKVRMRCLRREECLPFYILVSFGTRAQREAAAGKWNSASPRPVTPPKPASAPWLVRTGDRATLVIESEHMRAELPVICLSNGWEGQRIRVSSVDRKQTYVANVAGIGLLKGRL